MEVIVHPTKVKFEERGEHTLAFEVSIDHPEPWEHQGPFGTAYTSWLECDPALHKEWVVLMNKILEARKKAEKQGRLV